MPSGDILEVKGELREISPEGTYRVAIRAGHEVLCTAGEEMPPPGEPAPNGGEGEGWLRPGDRVLVRIPADDLEHGRIVHRYGPPRRGR